MSHLLHHYHHASRTISNIADRPTLKVWEWELPKWGPTHTSPLRGGTLCHKALWAHNIYVATVGMDLSNEVNFFRSGPPCSLYKDGFFHKHVWPFRVNVIFQTLHHMKTLKKNHIWKENTWFKKTHSPKSLDDENKERVRKNTIWAVPHMGRGFSAQGKYLMSFNLIPTTCHLKRERCQTWALTSVFQWGAVIVRDTFLSSCQERVKNLEKECWFTMISDIHLKRRDILCVQSFPGLFL